MRKLASTILIVCLSQVCFAQQKTITGKLSGFKDNTKVKLFDQEMMSVIDSTYIQNGKFIFKNPIDNSIPKVLSITVFDSVLKFIVLFIANDNVEISGDIKDFPYDLKIIGSKSQSEQSLLNEKFKSLQKERDEIVKFWRTEVTDKNESYQAKLKESNIRARQIDQATDSIKKQYINSHINSYVSLRGLSYLKKQYSTDELQSLYSKLETKYKYSTYGIALYNYITIGDIIKENDDYSDFEAYDNKGVKHKLSDFNGKYILLDFTKEFCGPCEKAIKELKIIHEKYSDKITIISFTAEKSKEFWKEGIIRNKINWLSLWDGNGANSKTIMKYGVDGYPNFFLINIKGKVVEIIDGYSDGILMPKVEKLISE